MKHVLEESGFKFVIGSTTGRTFLIDEITLESDIKLTDVSISGYAGFIITCSGLGSKMSPGSKSALVFGETFVKPEKVAVAKQIAAMNKPVAAQDRGVRILAAAGALEGKKYSYDNDLLISEATCGGQGVIQDGNAITAPYCPHYADIVGQKKKDQTTQLAKTLIGLLQQ